MNLLHKAYVELFPDRPASYVFNVSYSGRFRGYNANIRKSWSTITVNLSKEWKGVSPDIQLGLLQELLVRLTKSKTQTINMDLYHNFMRSLPSVAPKTETHPILEESFDRVNSTFFNSMMERPNLRISAGLNRVGTYEYGTDTVSISNILLEDPLLMDYVMYHELLHKKHQYKANHGRSRHHSAAFRTDEKKFPNAELLERRLAMHARKHKSRWRFF